MSTESLSPRQFNTERSMIEQGNADDLVTRVRGIQNMTSNVFRPAFSHDYMQATRQPSGTVPGQAVEQQEDEE